MRKLAVLKGLLSPMLYMFFFIAAGFVLRRLKVLPDNAAQVLSRLESDFIISAMIINAFTRYCTPASIRDNAMPMLLCTGLWLVIFALSFPLSGLIEKDGYYRNMYRYQLLFTSWGFMGYALVQALFGAESLYRFILFTLPMSILCYVYGIPLLTPQQESGKAAWKNLFNPSIIATMIGAAMGLSGFEKIMPDFLSDALGALSSMFGPVAMLLTGLTIGSYSLKEMFTDRRSYLICFFRMILIPPVLIGLAWLLGAERESLLFLLFAHAVPLGLFPVIYPPRFGKDARPGASMALVSNLLCLITIPLFYSLLLKLLGEPG